MHLKIISNTDNGDDICSMHLRPCVMIEWNTNVEDTIYNLFVGLGRIATLFPYQHNYKCSRNRLINRIPLKVHHDYRFKNNFLCVCVSHIVNQTTEGVPLSKTYEGKTTQYVPLSGSKNYH